MRIKFSDLLVFLGKRGGLASQQFDGSEIVDLTSCSETFGNSFENAFFGTTVTTDLGSHPLSSS